VRRETDLHAKIRPRLRGRVHLLAGDADGLSGTDRVLGRSSRTVASGLAIREAGRRGCPHPRQALHPL